MEWIIGILIALLILFTKPALRELYLHFLEKQLEKIKYLTNSHNTSDDILSELIYRTQIINKIIDNKTVSLTRLKGETNILSSHIKNLEKHMKKMKAYANNSYKIPEIPEFPDSKTELENRVEILKEDAKKQLVTLHKAYNSATLLKEVCKDYIKRNSSNQPL